MTEIFDKADTSNTGKLTIPEYLELCRNYNIEVTEDDLETITSMAETNGGELSKNDFIIFVRQTNMYAHFDTVDPESDQHWENMIKHAWKMFDKVSIISRYLDIYLDISSLQPTNNQSTYCSYRTETGSCRSWSSDG